MNSVKMYVFGWVTGLIFGLVLMERWHRKGAHLLDPDDVGDAFDLDAATISMEVSADQPRVTTVIVAGAKADAERARQMLVRVVPWNATSVRSVAELRRWARPAKPGDSPNP